MEAFNIQSNKKELIIRLDKSAMPTEILLKIANRLRLEYLAQKAGFGEDLTKLTDKIDNDWWASNGNDFLKDVDK